MSLVNTLDFNYIPCILYIRSARLTNLAKSDYIIAAHAFVRATLRFRDCGQFRSQRPRSSWLATEIATSGQVQLRKSAIHGLPVALRMFRVRSGKSDWFWSQSIVFTKPFKTGMSLDLATGPMFQSMTKGTPRDELGLRALLVALKNPDIMVIF